MTTVITEQSKKLAEEVKSAFKHLDAVYPIVKAYQAKIMTENFFLNEDTGERVTNSELIYNCSDSDCEIFGALCEQEADKSGLYHKPECCPLLEAESRLRDAKYNLTKYMISVLPHMQDISVDDFLRFEDKKKKDKYGHYIMHIDSFVDLTLKLFK